MPKRGPTTLYSLRIELQGIEPLIWRRVVVPIDIPLPRLHLVFQAVMGWKNRHAHTFVVNYKDYGVPDEHFPGLNVDEKGKVLNQPLGESIREFTYDYDFGDAWEHRVVVESTQEGKWGFPYPLCLAGERAYPPEDVGGPPGYEEFLAAIKDPKHEEHEEKMLWGGGFFDPDGFDVNVVNEKLRG